MKVGPLFVDAFQGDLGGPPSHDEDPKRNAAKRAAWFAMWKAKVEKLLTLGAPYHGMIIKATEGTTYDVRWFAEVYPMLRQLAGARFGRDWWRGAYAFLLFAQRGRPQAEFLLRTVKAAGGIGLGDLWLSLDVELGGPTHPNQKASPQQIVDVTTEAAEFLEQETGQKPTLYGNGAMRDKGITSKMGCGRLWIPRYTATLPREMYERAGWSEAELLLWQYGGDGEASLAGYPRSPPGFGAIDMSVLVLPRGLEQLVETLPHAPPNQAPPTAPKPTVAPSPLPRATVVKR